MPALTGVRVKGFNDLQRAFKAAGGELKKESRRALKTIGEIVSEEAERLALEEISHIRSKSQKTRGRDWSKFRVGVTQRLVYVAPKQRGRLSARNTALLRPNLAPLLMDKAMEPALQNNIEEVEREFGVMLDRVVDRWGR